MTLLFKKGDIQKISPQHYELICQVLRIAMKADKLFIIIQELDKPLIIKRIQP
jgi:hypothetical protein